MNRKSLAQLHNAFHMAIEQMHVVHAADLEYLEKARARIERQRAVLQKIMLTHAILGVTPASPVLN